MSTADKEKKVQRVKLSLAPETAARLYALAKADRRTLSDFVTNLINDCDLPT